MTEKYRGYKITQASADAMAYLGAKYEFVHDDYGGPEDKRLGFAGTIEEAKALIDDLEADNG